MEDVKKVEAETMTSILSSIDKGLLSELNGLELRTKTARSNAQYESWKTAVKSEIQKSKKFVMTLDDSCKGATGYAVITLLHKVKAFNYATKKEFFKIANVKAVDVDFSKRYVSLYTRLANGTDKLYIAAR